MRCPMCHLPLDAEAQAQVCRRCPLHRRARGCRLRLVRCPRCGYHSLPEEPAEGAERPQAVAVALEPLPTEGFNAVRPLSELAAGARAHLMGFDGLKEEDLKRLVAYGLVPGVRLEVLQRLPALILKVHETELALDEGLTRAIYVRLQPPSHPSRASIADPIMPRPRAPGKT